MRRRVGFGLQPRLVLAFLLLSALTLGITALAVFSPLERRLEQDELRGLVERGRAVAPSFSSLSAEDLRPGSARLARVVRIARRRAGAQVIVVDARSRLLAGTDIDPGQDIPDLRRAVSSGVPVRGIAGTGDEAEARVALSVETRGGRIGLGLRNPLDEARSAAKVFQTGFVTAALISLAVALGMGVLLATRLARRLRSLREAALLVAKLGPAVEVQPDDARDEVGDLTRAFASMQTRLAEQEQARRNFVATASHELRTPLTTLRLRLGLLRDDIERASPDIEDAREQILRAEAQAERLAGLAADLLDLSRIDAGVSLASDPVPLLSLCRATVEEFEITSEQERTRVALSNTDECVAVGDGRSITQIVRILVDNALRFAPSERAIRLEVRSEPRRAIVTVEDDGPGLDEEDRDRVFGRFERGAETNGQPGFGLGLAIGRELARRMQGDLTFEGNEPTRFSLSLPRWRATGD